MGVCLFANDAVASLASAVLTTDTELSLATGAGALFPSPANGDYFNAAIYSATQQEYVKCTARSADVLTVIRAQENTAALAFAAGDKVELRLTAATMEAMAQGSGQGTAASRDIGFAPGEVADGEFSVRTGMGLPFFGPAAAVPSGYLLCDGSAVSRTTYARLYDALGGASSPYGQGDGSTTFNLPNGVDIMLVGAGNKYPLAGTGGADTAQVTVQGHALTTAEIPSHSHTWTDTPHSHGVNDSGHGHGVSDPGHAHGVSDPGHAHGIGWPTAQYYGTNGGGGSAGFVSGPNVITADVPHSTGGSGTGIGIYGANTGVTIAGATSNISLQASHINGSIGATGSGGAHAHPVTVGTNLPPYLAINWIIKT